MAFLSVVGMSETPAAGHVVLTALSRPRRPVAHRWSNQSAQEVLRCQILIITHQESTRARVLALRSGRSPLLAITPAVVYVRTYPIYCR
jgi:hypothetical protein